MSCDQDVDPGDNDVADEDDTCEPDPDGAYDRMVEEALFGDLAAL